MNRRSLLALPLAGAAGLAAAKVARASSPTDEINVADYGIVPSAADNSPAMAVLLATLAAHTALNFPKGTYLFSAPIAPLVPVTIRGLGGALGSVLKTTSATGDLIVVTRMGTVVQDIGLGSTVVKTAGALLRASVPLLTVKDVMLDGYFQGMVLNGCTISLVDNVWGGLAMAPTPASVAAGGGLAFIGTELTSSALMLRKVGANAPAEGMPSYGVWVSSCQDLALVDLSIIHHGVDLAIGPGEGQGVYSLNAVNSYFDTATRGVLIVPTGNGVVARCGFTQCWASSHTSDGFRIVEPAGTIVESIRIDGCTASFNGGRGIMVGSNVDRLWVTGNDLKGNALGGLLDHSTGSKVVTGNIS